MFLGPIHNYLARVTWDDKLLHYTIGSVALVVGSTLKAGVEWIGKRLWNKGVKKVQLSIKEHEEFEAWKASRKKE